MQGLFNCTQRLGYGGTIARHFVGRWGHYASRKWSSPAGIVGFDPQILNLSQIHSTRASLQAPKRLSQDEIPRALLLSSRSLQRNSK